MYGESSEPGLAIRTDLDHKLANILSELTMLMAAPDYGAIELA